MAACVGNGSNDTFVEDRLEEVLSLIAPSKGNGDAYPSADDRENREHHQRKEHDPRRLVDAVRVALFGIGDHNGVAAGVGVNGGSVIVKVGVFLKVFWTKEGLEPQPEHIKRGDAGSNQADEPEEFAKRIVAGEGAVEDFIFGKEAG